MAGQPLTDRLPERENRQCPPYHAATHAEPSYPVTPRANPGHPDRSTNGKTIELLSTQTKDTNQVARLYILEILH